MSTLGHITACLTLSMYENGQPRLDVRYDDLSTEELTIEVPGFDLRAFDADHAFKRLHLVFRSEARAALFAGCDIVSLTSLVFTDASGSPALQIVWLPTPTAWSRIQHKVAA